ncbi:MAG: 7-carboxy-7-deazaguanine synthase QueE [Myxococcota bacterium]
MRDAEANLVEIFSSVQGEGIHAGMSTLFIRFGECDLRCRWCDTPHSWKPAVRCRIERARGSGDYRECDNPVAIDAVIAAAEALEFAAHRFVSLTGGEPLLQPDAVLAVAARLRGRGPRLYLETHGLLADALGQVLGAVDVVSMDWKLTSDVRRAADPRHGPVEAFHAAHEAFLRIARSAPEVMVKVVVTPGSEDDELDEMADRVSRVDRDIPVIVQPVTPFGSVKEGADPGRLLGLANRLERLLSDVRVIPQTHKSYGVP